MATDATPCPTATSGTRRTRRPAGLHRAGRDPAIDHRQDQRHRPRPADRHGLARLLRLQRAAAAALCRRHHLPDRRRRRHLGHRHPRRLGLRHHLLRLVDRHRPRRHADLRYPAADAPEMAHVDQPPGRGHDHLRRDVRRHVPAAAPGPALVLLLAAALPQHDGPVAAVPQRPGLGRVRRQHLFHGVADLLVHGHDPRPGHAARPRDHAPGPRRLRRAGAGLAQLRPALAALRDRPTCCSAGLATPLVVSVHSVVSSDFAMSNLPGWHETVFPPYFVAGAIFSGFAMVLVLAIILRRSTAWRTSSPSITWK